MNRSSLDARSKLIALLAATCILVALELWFELAVAQGILLIVTVSLGLGSAWLRLLKGLGFAALTFFIIAWLAFDLPTAASAALRLLSIGTAFFLFFQTTSPEALSNALIKMGIPYPFVFVLTASIQFIPVLMHKIVSIRDAQRARGIPLDAGLGALRYFPALAAPLLIQAFQLADDLAEAMEARGFGAPGRRFRYEPHLTVLDWVVMMVSTAAAAIAIVI